MGRPSSYSADIADHIVERLIEGDSLRTICAADAMPNRSTVLRWLDDDPDFAARYARAREMQGDFMDDLILEAANTTTPENAAAARVKIDAYKWRASKLKAKVYGDSTTLKHADADGEKLDLDPVARATRIAAIFGDIEKRASGAAD